jgi:microcin C transport system substrate-binding protein
MASYRLGFALFLPAIALCLLLSTAHAQDKAPGEENLDKVLPFNPGEWLTGSPDPPLGDPRAERDSDVPFKAYVLAFITTLRTEGPNSNTGFNREYLEPFIYESMIDIHPETEEFIPLLATHWKREVDWDNKKQTFWFRLNPKARWADGSEVTAADVYWSWWHRTQEDRKDPSNVMTFKENYEEPEIVDKYTIRVTTTELNWRLFIYFGGMLIFPAEEVRIPGDKYLADYNWKFMVGSGPYHLLPEDLKKGESIALTRREDWWAKDEPWAKGLYNFKKFKIVVIRDREMIWEKFKKDELPLYFVGKAQRWVEIIPHEPLVKKGWVQRRKCYNQSPRGATGFAFNMRKWPFNDKNVRLAFCHLFNREKLMEKLFFDEYEYIDSYWPGRDWGNGENNPEIYYDPELAAELLAKAGFKRRNKEGWLVDEQGRVLEVTHRYSTQEWERIWLVVAEGFRKAGINYKLKLIDSSTLLRKIGERQFTLHYQFWGAILFPNPETAWRSDLADKKYNNNIPGFKNARVDELCEKYNVIFDRAEQKKLIREIDSIVFKEHPYALGWYSNFVRPLYWDRLGHPKTYFTRTGISPFKDVFTHWWWDSRRAARLEEAMEKEEPLPQGPKEVRPWDDEEE